MSVGLPCQGNGVFGDVGDDGLVRRTGQLEGLRGLNQRWVGALWSRTEATFDSTHAYRSTYVKHGTFLRLKVELKGSLIVSELLTASKLAALVPCRAPALAWILGACGEDEKGTGGVDQQLQDQRPLGRHFTASSPAGVSCLIKAQRPQRTPLLLNFHT